MYSSSWALACRRCGIVKVYCDLVKSSRRPTIMDYSQYPINPNWFHLHIAYHGSASSVVISGTDIVRPRGQAPPAEKSSPYFGRSRKLDFDLEMAAIPGNDLGTPIDVNNASDHIFGLVLMND